MNENNLITPLNNIGNESSNLARELAKLIENPMPNVAPSQASSGVGVATREVVINLEGGKENSDNENEIGVEATDYSMVYQQFAKQKSEAKERKNKEQGVKLPKSEINPTLQPTQEATVAKEAAVALTNSAANKDVGLIEEVNFEVYETIPTTAALTSEVASSTAAVSDSEDLANLTNDEDDEKEQNYSNSDAKVKKRTSATKGFFTNNQGSVSHHKVMIAVMLAITLGYFLLLPGDNKSTPQKAIPSKGKPAKQLKSEVQGSLQASGLPEWKAVNATKDNNSSNRAELTNLAEATNHNSDEANNGEPLPELIIPKTIEIGSNKNSNSGNGNNGKPNKESVVETTVNSVQDKNLNSTRQGFTLNNSNIGPGADYEQSPTNTANQTTTNEAEAATDSAVPISMTRSEGFTKKFRAATPKVAPIMPNAASSDSKPSVKLVTFSTTVGLRLLEPARSGLTNSVKALVLQDVKSGSGEVVIPANSIAVIGFLSSNIQGRLLNDPRQTVNFLLPNGEEIAAYGLLKGADGLLGIAGKERKLKGGGGALGAVGRSVKRVGSTIGAVAIGGVEGAIVKDTIDETGLNPSTNTNDIRVVEIKAGASCTFSIQANIRK